MPTASARCACSKRSASSGLEKKTRFYQASTSELYGLVQETPQKETTPFYPRSPYARRQAVRLLDHRQLPRGLRHVCLQRHPLQPREPAARRDLRHPQDHARAGAHRARPAGLPVPRQPDALRDWGHAKDYVEMQWLMLQQEQPEDFVIATGVQYSVRQFVELAARRARHHAARSSGEGEQRDRHASPAVDGDRARVQAGRRRRPRRSRATSGRPRSRRCSATPSKAKAKLGWTPTITLPELVRGDGRGRLRLGTARQPGQERRIPGL